MGIRYNLYTWYNRPHLDCWDDTYLNSSITAMFIASSNHSACKSPSRRCAFWWWKMWHWQTHSNGTWKGGSGLFHLDSENNDQNRVGVWLVWTSLQNYTLLVLYPFFPQNIPISQQMPPQKWLEAAYSWPSLLCQGKKLRQFCIEKWIGTKLMEQHAKTVDFFFGPKNQEQIRIYQTQAKKSTNWCKLTKTSAGLKQKVWVRPLNYPGIQIWGLTENSVLGPWTSLFDGADRMKQRRWQWLGIVTV